MIWSKDLVIGIVSGISVSILSYCFWWSIRWLRNAVSKEASLSKKWFWFDLTQSKTESVGTMDLRQVGSNLSGSLHRTTSRSGEKTNRVFDFSGQFYGDYALLSYHETANPRIVLGVIALKLIPNGKMLYGRTLYFEHHSGKFATFPFAMSVTSEIPKESEAYFKKL